MARKIIRTATGRSITATTTSAGVEVIASDGWSPRSVVLSSAEARDLRDFLVANVKDEDLFDKFSALAVGDQFTLLSDKNAARGTRPSKAIKVDANTYYSYKHSKLNNAAEVLTGKPGSITKN